MLKIFQIMYWIKSYHVLYKMKMVSQGTDWVTNCCNCYMQLKIIICKYTIFEPSSIMQVGLIFQWNDLLIYIKAQNAFYKKLIKTQSECEPFLHYTGRTGFKVLLIQSRSINSNPNAKKHCYHRNEFDWLNFRGHKSKKWK